MAQNPRASRKQVSTAICFLEIELLIRVGIHWVKDVREGAGDSQKVADDESELAEEEVEH